MIKKILFFLCFEMNFVAAKAQNTYTFIYKEVLSSNETYFYRLVFNQNSSLYLSNRSFEKKTVLKLESPKSVNDTLSNASDEKLNELLYKPSFNLRKLYFDEEGNVLYKNFRDSIILDRTIVSSSESLLITEPKLPKMNWMLIDSSKKIANFVCQKAITTFRGRKYEAWYTLEIPISNGPWKFHGLPGLIIRANTIDNKFVYEFVTVEKSETNNYPIKEPKLGRKVSIIDLAKETEKIHEEQDRKSMVDYAQRGLSMKVSTKTDFSTGKELNYDDIK